MYSLNLKDNNNTCHTAQRWREEGAEMRRMEKSYKNKTNYILFLHTEGRN